MSAISSWVDGAVLPMSAATHSIFDHVTSYGTGVFEGIRVYPELDRNNQPTGRQNVWLLNEHIVRLRESARLYGMYYSFSNGELMEAVVDLVRRNSGHSYIRPVVFRGDGLGVDPSNVPVCVAIGTVAWGRYVSKHLHNNCASVLVSSLIRPPELLFRLGQAKGGPNYGAWSQLAKIEANQAEVSEALLQGQDIHRQLCIVDGSGMNLCIVKNGRIITPNPPKWNVLHGLTLQFLLEWIQLDDLKPWQYGDINLEDLLSADEVFLTGTATEVTPVTLVKYSEPWGSFNQREIGNGQAGPVALHLAEVLRRATHGQNDQYRDFLTPVSTPTSAVA